MLLPQGKILPVIIGRPTSLAYNPGLMWQICNLWAHLLNDIRYAEVCQAIGLVEMAEGMIGVQKRTRNT